MEAETLCGTLDDVVAEALDVIEGPLIQIMKLNFSVNTMFYISVDIARIFFITDSLFVNFETSCFFFN